jgi:hypothetical protein
LLLATGVAVFFGAAAALVSSSTFGFFSTNASSSANTFTAGTVTQSRTAGGDCAVTNLFPDGTAHNCGTLQVSYRGSVPAYLAVDVLIETQAGSGGHKLYDPSDSSHDVQVTVASTSPTVASYSLPATPLGSCPGGAPVGSTCYELDKDLVSTTPFTNASSPVTLTTSVKLPTSSTTDYQGGAAQIYLTVHAAQSGNNPATGCSAGQPCTAVSWS